ncbi:MAG: hypothetical protein JNJ71_08635 [Rubrivivax sp.]|nr:hypothetical protein [Rubrivivax sp.]
MAIAEGILLPLQRLQYRHDELAHSDILGLPLKERVQHMVLHFFKYAGRIEDARLDGSRAVLRATLIDAFIICMASANALGVSLGQYIPECIDDGTFDSLARIMGKRLAGKDLAAEALSAFLSSGGKMAKAVESLDHQERGPNWREEAERHLVALTRAVIALLGCVGGDIEHDLRARLHEVEGRSFSVFLRTPEALK